MENAYLRETLDSQLKTELLTALQPAFAKISEQGIRYSALPGHTMEMADALNEVLSAKWKNLRGIEIVSLGVSGVKASEEDEAMLKAMQRDAAYMDPTRGAIRLVKLISEKHSLIAREGVYDAETNRWFDARMQWLTWTDDTPARMIIATDITNQRETELALEAQMKRAETTQRLVTMGEMASSLAHELNQPLAAISNYASGASMMLQAGKLTREDTIGALDKVNRQAQRAAAIIKRIRGFAATKKTEPQFTSLTPESVVNETMELALIQAEKLNARINTTIEPNLPAMTGDSVMLEQLLLNLLKNAMEAVQPCPNHTIDLDVRLHESGSFIQFRVADHGTGIPDDAKTMLFDAFYSTKDEGMGMGLNICRSIVEVHHGRIVISDTPGGGATFTFTVPVAREHPDLM